jgi:hypothetical protein
MALEVAAECATEKPKWALLRWCRRLRYLPQDRYLNRYCHTYWSVLEKTQGHSNAIMAAGQIVLED